MRPWLPVVLLAAGIVAVLVLGAAANGFEPSLDHASASPPPARPPANTVSSPKGLLLPATVVATLFDRVDGSAAVVVRVSNPNARRSIVDASITVELLDGAGRSLGTNTHAGSLYTHVPYIAPGASAIFVSDTLQPNRAPARARATAVGALTDDRQMQLRLNAGTPRKTPFEWVVDVSRSALRGVRPQRVYAAAVVRRGNRIVAAGAAIVPIPTRSSKIFLHGDARGGVVSVWASAR